MKLEAYRLAVKAQGKVQDLMNRFISISLAELSVLKICILHSLYQERGCFCQWTAIMAP